MEALLRIEKLLALVPWILRVVFPKIASLSCYLMKSAAVLEIEYLIPSQSDWGVASQPTPVMEEVSLLVVDLVDFQRMRVFDELGRLLHC